MLTISHLLSLPLRFKKISVLTVCTVICVICVLTAVNGCRSYIDPPHWNSHKVTQPTVSDPQTASRTVRDPRL